MTKLKQNLSERRKKLMRKMTMMSLQTTVRKRKSLTKLM